MKYTEYKKSAKRHLDTCGHLIKTLNSVQAKTTHSQQECQNNLILNVFYLSGYVVECILKFTFFQSIHYDRTKDVESLDQDHCDKVFKDLRTHRVDELIALVEKYDKHLPPDLPFFRQKPKKEIEKMFKSWTPDQRYNSMGIDKTTVEEYLSVVTQIHSKLANR